MRDVNYKATNTPVERNFYYSMPKFAQQNGKIGIQGYRGGHPLKTPQITLRNPSSKNVKSPYDSATKYKRRMDNWREGMAGEGSLAFRLQLRSRPEVQLQIRNIESEVPMSTPNRNQIIDQMIDNLLRTIEQEEIRTGAAEGIKARFGIVASDARRYMEQIAASQRRRDFVGRGTRSQFGMDTYDAEEEVYDQDSMPPSVDDDDYGDEELDLGEDEEEAGEGGIKSRPAGEEAIQSRLRGDEEPRFVSRRIPEDENIGNTLSRNSLRATKYLEFIKQEAAVDDTVKRIIDSTGREEMMNELSMTQDRIYKWVYNGIRQGYDPMVRLASRVQSLLGSGASIPQRLDTDEDILRFSALTGIEKRNAIYMREYIAAVGKDAFGGKRQKYSIQALARARSRNKPLSTDEQLKLSMEAVVINSLISSIGDGEMPTFDGPQPTEGETMEDIDEFMRTLQ